MLVHQLLNERSRPDSYSTIANAKLTVWLLTSGASDPKKTQADRLKNLLVTNHSHKGALDRPLGCLRCRSRTDVFTA